MTSVKLLLVHLAQAALLRGRLVSLELGQERRRLFSLIGWFTATAFFGMMTVIVATLFVIALFWEWNPLVALGGVAGAYAVLALVAFLRLNYVLNHLPGVLERTLSVLEKDYACWVDEKSAS